MTQGPAQDIRPRNRDRDYDVVVFGATGFAGEIVAEYLAERYADSDVRWAIAGRNEGKLKGVQAKLVANYPDAGEVPYLVADSMDEASLKAMASSSSVVCTTVGPYAKYGEKLVAACIDEGTDYVDLTGETQFIRRMLDRHHEAAQEKGVRIVHCCGFDSIPSDLGTLALQDAVIARDGEPVDEVKFILLGGSGGFSGGTIASMVNLMEEAKDGDVRRILGHPYSLNPEGERKGPDGSDQMGPAKDEVTGWWTGPFVMAAINTRIVRRSNALLGYRYGRDFRYSEVMRMGKGVKGAVSATLLSGGFGAFYGLMAIGPARKALDKFVLPDPGEGPSREKIESGFFKILISGRKGDAEVARVTVSGKRDPGYGATSCMLAESALCLALQGNDLRSPGGILTPASAMGQTLIERLEQQDLTFEIDV